MHTVVYGNGTQYLMDIVWSVSQLTGRSHQRSAQKEDFDIPRTQIHTDRDPSVAAAAPRAWNHLTADIQRLSTVSSFERHLKIYLFMTAY